MELTFCCYQKQPSRGILRKRCSENILQMYRKKPMPKCEVLCNFIEITIRHGYSPVNLLHIFRTPFLKNTSGWLLLCYLWTHWRSKYMPLHKKMKFSIKNFFSKSDQIHSFLRTWSHLLKKSLMKNFIFCAVWGGAQEYKEKWIISGVLQ